MIPSLLEIALRALLVAGAVWAGLRLLGLRDVLAQKVAWGLVLAAAILMPLLLPLAMRWQVLSFALPRALWQLKTPASASTPAAATAAGTESRPATTAARSAYVAAAPAAHEDSFSAAAAGNAQPAYSSAAATPASGAASPRSTIEVAPPVVRAHSAPPARPLLPTLRVMAIPLYLAVCAVFLLRLVYGLTSAVSLWLNAEPVDLEPMLGCDPSVKLPVRVSRSVSSPVTVGSGVILPARYDEWDAEKLRVVLAHERSHIRQGDFYLQLGAEFYSALVWFSPLGWWLKRKLSDLGEAISDRAGLQEAASRSSYAQILLEFAAMPRTTLIGVAMARSSSLSHRIERLLNDSTFRQAFSGSRTRALLAMLLVPAALFGATALIRVEAAGAARQAAPPPPSPTPAARGAVAPAAPLAKITVEPVDEPSSPIAPPALEEVGPLQPMARPRAEVLMYAPLGRLLTSPQLAATPMARAFALDRIRPMIAQNGQAIAINSHNGRRTYLSTGSGNGFSYWFNSDGDSYALVTDPKAVNIRFSGDWMDGRTEELKKAAAAAHGGFLWFSHDDKSYIVDDPAIVSSIDAMYKPIEELGREQEELGKKQEELGRQQEELGKKQEEASVPTPDLSKEIAELNALVAKLQSKKGGTVTQEELGDLQGKIGDLQGRIGDIEGKIGEEQGRLGDEQGKLGEKQGELGEEQGCLGEKQGRLSEEVDRKIKGIIADSLQNGKARQVQ